MASISNVRRREARWEQHIVEPSPPFSEGSGLCCEPALTLPEYVDTKVSTRSASSLRREIPHQEKPWIRRGGLSGQSRNRPSRCLLHCLRHIWRRGRSPMHPMPAWPPLISTSWPIAMPRSRWLAPRHRNPYRWRRSAGAGTGRIYDGRQGREWLRLPGGAGVCRLHRFH